MTDPALRRACARVAHKDARPLRRALFAQLAARTPALRVALAAWDRLRDPRARAALVTPLMARAFARVLEPSTDGDVLAVCEYANERRQVDALRRLAPAIRIVDLPLGLSTARPPVPPLALLIEHAAGGDFLVTARVAETIGAYLRLRPLIAASPARAVLVSSDGNPLATAAVAAAERAGKRTCFVAHGHAAEGPPALDFDLSLLDGPAQREVYERAGAIPGQVVFRGSEGRARPMRLAPLAEGVRTLGVVLSILVHWSAVGAALARLRASLRPERVVLRLHPNRAMRDPRWAASLSLDGVRVSLGEVPLEEDVRGCDLVAAANTSAHLTVLKLGVPTVHVPELDTMGDDLYGFVGGGVVAASAPDDLEGVARFYDAPEWAGRFARFDAGYPDRQPACDGAVAEALTGLVERPARSVAPTR